MRYEEPLFRPPSEADSLILQATVGCSWNACTYCAMYRSKRFRVRPLAEILEDIAAAAPWAESVRHVFVADGDPLGMDLDHWEPILRDLAATFPRLRRVSTYATARNLLEKTPAELRRLGELGLTLLYIGPESGDDETLRRIAKGADAADHVEAARRAREAGMEQSLIFLLGAGGRERSEVHARASGRLATAMEEAMAAAGKDPVARLRANGRAYVEFARREPALFGLMFGPYGAGGPHPVSGTGPKTGLSAFQLLQRALDDLVLDGLMSAKRRAGAESLLWSSVHGLATLANAGVSREPAVTAFDNMFPLVRKALGLGKE